MFSFPQDRDENIFERRLDGPNLLRIEPGRGEHILRLPGRCSRIASDDVNSVAEKPYSNAGETCAQHDSSPAGLSRTNLQDRPAHQSLHFIRGSHGQKFAAM